MRTMEGERDGELLAGTEGKGVRGPVGNGCPDGAVFFLKEMVDLRKNIQEIVHDINNPLQNLFTIAQLISRSTEGMNDQKIDSYVQKITEQGLKIDSLLRQLQETINSRVDRLDDSRS